MRPLRRPFAMLTLLFALLAIAAGAAEVPIPPPPVQWATDTANVLSPQTVDQLDARLRAYQTHTGRQILVYVTPTTGTTPTEDWTVRTFARWKVGRQGMNDGLILFVFPKDRKVRIEVGYGLEQTIPDATAARIIRDTIAPKLQAGEPDAAIVAGVDAILGTFGDETTSVAAGSPGTASESSNGDDDGPPAWSIVLGIVIALGIVGVVIFLIGKLPRGSYISRRSSGFGIWDAVSLVGGGILGGGSGGGGFSGGGGMSGGGGATGSW